VYCKEGKNIRDNVNNLFLLVETCARNVEAGKLTIGVDQSLSERCEGLQYFIYRSDGLQGNL
jgi:hypothetical protein